ncbi:hypothetical protein SAMN06272735_7691 [Streptomyces sp. TLI_55]|uniref:Imm32 family immunity protein n=1 Tax=Streptomyces sp. TLI_55 TaxID=1938861 RepID=UPI000BC37394|nr:hypothetical protein [Streptomyces sp. TLI_55]SNX65851.1 hypothetical protein SAMN06272735_7691 [Streptomyces sp. TLI_55]
MSPKSPRVLHYPASGEVDLSAPATELHRLARALAQGEGLLWTMAGPDGDDRVLAGVEVRDTPGSAVRIALDPARRVLLIGGDSDSRALFAANLRVMADAEDGGHLHVDHFPDHPYLAEGSLPLVVNSPHGGMPGR